MPLSLRHIIKFDKLSQEKRGKGMSRKFLTLLEKLFILSTEFPSFFGRRGQCIGAILWLPRKTFKLHVMTLFVNLLRYRLFCLVSHAYGTPTEDSDVDLLVVMDIPESETTRQAGEIWQRIPRRFNMDLLVRSPKEIAYRVSHNDWFLREITEKGEVLYESIPCAYNVEDKGDGHIKEESIMNPLTIEWTEKAERDYAAILLHQQVESPDFDFICFHAQQCIEKYLKSLDSGCKCQSSEIT